MSELEELTKEKLDYMNEWVASGRKVIDLVHDDKFIKCLKKETVLIEQLNKEIQKGKECNSLNGRFNGMELRFECTECVNSSNKLERLNFS